MAYIIASGYWFPCCLRCFSGLRVVVLWHVLLDLVDFILIFLVLIDLFIRVVYVCILPRSILIIRIEKLIGAGLCKTLTIFIIIEMLLRDDVACGGSGGLCTDSERMTEQRGAWTIVLHQFV